MPLGAFGPGIAIVTRTDVTPSTPIDIGFGQSLMISDKGTNKQLYGRNQYPLIVARGTIKSTGKFVTAESSGIAMNSMFWGQTFQTGGIQWNIAEPHSIPGVSTYTIQATNHTTFDADLGVIYAATGLPFQKVASVTAAGQYSGPVAGTYTFDVADASAAVLITYSSTISGGQTLPVYNTLIGSAPTFQLDYYTSVNQPAPKPLIVRLYACVASSLDMDFKLEDFMMPSFEFDYFANPAGLVKELIFPEVS